MIYSHPHLSHPKYRPDIDGLRALAVLSVVAFHAFPGWVKGGFIGVDVFFVISGYLISTIIFANLDKGTFSFSEFYARRIKRIFPALLLVLIASYAFGWFTLLADEYKQLGKHIAAGAGFVSNIILWNEAGYFDNSAETKPLLHLWSLGIEEQFYIVWPPLLWFAWKRKFGFLTITILLAIASFYLNIEGVKNDSVATFYSPQTRFWELFSGSILAWVNLYKKGAFSRKTLSNILSFLGLLLLVYGFWRINKDFSFPGKWATVPVLGTVLIISAGPKAWINRTILSNRLAVWFGLISFPLYLWHWTLLTFARIVESEVPNVNIRIAAVILAIALSWLTYKLVERPIRLGAHNRLKVSGLVFLMLSVGYVGYQTYGEDGFPLRNSLSKNGENNLLIQAIKDDNPISHADCMGMYNLKDKIRFCNVSTTTKPKIALIGDSHARAFYDGLSEILGKRNEGILNIGGRLFLDVASYPIGNLFEIEVYKGGIKATQFALDEPTIHTVIMVSGYFRPSSDSILQLIDKPEITDARKIFEIAMRNTIKKFVAAKKNVIFVIDYPWIDFDPRACLDSRPFRLTNHVRNPCAGTRSKYDYDNTEYRNLVFSVLGEFPEVRVFDSAAYLCDEQWCWAMKNNKLLYRDKEHISLEGSRYLSSELVKVIDGEDSKILGR